MVLERNPEFVAGSDGSVPCGRALAFGRTARPVHRAKGTAVTLFRLHAIADSRSTCGTVAPEIQEAIKNGRRLKTLSRSWGSLLACSEAERSSASQSEQCWRG